jgi:serine/threonine protein kinase/formylglycine-generating enzyme required for sulfatase activity
MIGIAACPDVQEYERLRLGDLSGAEGERLLQHLEQCHRCLTVVQRLGASDTLVELMRAHAPTANRPEQDVIEALRQRLRLLRPAASARGEAGTLPPASVANQQEGVEPPRGPAASSQAGERTAECYDFLTPPRAPDKLGRLGPYRVLKVLGAGGMGVVFQAEDPRLGRLVALKAMLPQTAAKPGMKERFLREAKAAAAIEHDHIIPIYQVDEDRGVPYIAMPFLKGASLEDWLKKRQTGPHPMPLAVPQILKLGREIARGLAAAHEHGMIHRDIKPANIWLDSSVGGRVKILDFGLARLTQQAGEQHLTQSGAIMGTPSYMAPEQARAEEIDGRADLFSLGVVLYRLCTGTMPFKGGDMISTLMAVAMNVPAPPHALNPPLPRPLSDLVMKLLEKEPAKRMASAREVIAAIQALEREPVAPVAPPPVPAVITPAVQDSPRAERTEQPVPRLPYVKPARKRRPPRRHTLVVVAVAALALLLGGVVLLWPTAMGTVRIEVDDPDVKVTFDKNGATISGADKVPITLEPGEHGIIVSRGDFRFETDKLVLKKGATVTLKVTFHDGKLQVFKDGKVFAEREVPPAGSFRNSLGMEFVLVPKGRSWLGGGSGKPGETEVEVLQDFYLGKYEVTQEEWLKLMPSNPSHFSRHGDDNNHVKDVPDADLKRFPVDWVFWQVAQEFVQRLNNQLKEPGWTYRLPKEAEWEYACRGGPLADKSESEFDFYCPKPTSVLLQEEANYNNAQLLKGPCKVGSFKPNPLGLYDMHGNVAEWCEEQLDPKTPQGAVARVHRGGSWFNDSATCRASGRFGLAEDHAANTVGLRLARVPVGKEILKIAAQQRKPPAEEPKPQPKPGRSGLTIRTGSSSINIGGGGDGPEVIGSSKIAVVTRELTGFSAISLLIPEARVTVLPGEIEGLTLKGEDNLLPLLTSQVSDNTLTLGFADGSRVTINQPIEIEVRVKVLRQIQLHYNGTIEARGVRAESLDVVIHHNGTVGISGQADELKLTLMTNGTFRGAELATKRATLNVMTNGTAVVNVADQIDATFGGPGSVDYMGSPRVEVHQNSGHGRIRRIVPGNR